jgi:hypothetical protein
MNRKEQAELDAALGEVRRLRALLNMGGPAPIPVPAGPATGIWWINAHRIDTYDTHVSVAGAFGQGRRSGSGHSLQPKGDIWSQGDGEFYAGRREALLALRGQIVDRYARILVAIDDELAQPAHLPVN